MRSNILAAAAILLPAAAFAGGYAVPNTNARDEGMAGSAVANQTGPEAAFSNGAALAGQDGLGISASGALIDFGSTWTNLSGSTGQGASQDMIAKVATPVNLNIAYGLKLADMPMAVGFAMGVPYGGLIYWPYTWAGSANVIHVDRRVYSYDLVGAVQPIKQVKVSLGGTIYYATENLQQGLNFGTSEGNVFLGTSGTGLGWNISGEFTPVESLPLRIGVQYRHQSVLNLSGNAHFEGVPTAFQTQGLIDQSAKHTLVLPNELKAGVSYDVMPGLTVNAAVTFWRFIVYANDKFVGSEGLSVTVPRNYTNAMTYRLGGEYKLPFFDALTVRTGALRDVTPQPTTTLDPSLPESSRWAWSVGATYQIIPALSVSAAFEHAWFDQVTTTGTEAFPGTYNTFADVFALGLTYRMK